MEQLLMSEAKYQQLLTDAQKLVNGIKKHCKENDCDCAGEGVDECFLHEALQSWTAKYGDTDGK